MKKICLISILSICLLNANSQTNEENINASLLSIVNLVSGLPESDFCTLKGIISNEELTSEQKNYEISLNATLSTCISYVNTEISILETNGFFESANGTEFYENIWNNYFEEDLLGGRQNVSPCDAYNANVRLIGYSWMMCIVEVGWTGWGAVGCSFVALLAIDANDKSYPDCANGRNRSGSAYPIIPQWYLVNEYCND